MIQVEQLRHIWKINRSMNDHKYNTLKHCRTLKYMNECGISTFMKDTPNCKERNKLLAKDIFQNKLGRTIEIPKNCNMMNRPSLKTYY